MVSEGVEPVLLNYLAAHAPAGSVEVLSTEELATLGVDSFQTPLNRIIDQDQVMAQAARLFRYALEHAGAIRDELHRLTVAHPETIDGFDLDALSEDAIIIRTSLAGNIEFRQPQWPDASRAALSQALQRYQDKTLFLRNVMEYRKFDQELAAITDDATDHLGGRLNAYQRLIEDDSDSDTFKQRVKAAEYMYDQTNGRIDSPSKKETEELLELLNALHSEVK